MNLAETKLDHADAILAAHPLECECDLCDHALRLLEAEQVQHPERHCPGCEVRLGPEHDPDDPWCTSCAEERLELAANACPACSLYNTVRSDGELGTVSCGCGWNGPTALLRSLPHRPRPRLYALPGGAGAR